MTGDGGFQVTPSELAHDLGFGDGYNGRPVDTMGMTNREALIYADAHELGVREAAAAGERPAWFCPTCDDAHTMAWCTAKSAPRRDPWWARATAWMGARWARG